MSNSKYQIEDRMHSRKTTIEIEKNMKKWRYRIKTQITDIKIARVAFLIMLTSFYHTKLKF